MSFGSIGSVVEGCCWVRASPLSRPPNLQPPQLRVSQEYNKSPLDQEALSRTSHPMGHVFGVQHATGWAPLTLLGPRRPCPARFPRPKALSS